MAPIRPALPRQGIHSLTEAERRADLFEEHRPLIVGSPGLVIEERLQKP